MAKAVRVRVSLTAPEYKRPLSMEGGFFFGKTSLFDTIFLWLGLNIWHIFSNFFLGEKTMFKKILVPTDGSPLANQAAQEAVDLAKKTGAEVISVYVAVKNPIFGFDTAGDALNKTEINELVKQAANKVAEPLRELTQSAGVKLTERFCQAVSAADSIVAVAQESGCDLIYMASRGHSGWDKVFMGSVAAKVIAESPIPVLVYKVSEKQLPKDYWSYSAEV